MANLLGLSALLLGGAWAQTSPVLMLEGSGSYVFSEYVRRVADKVADLSNVPIKITYRSTTPLAGLQDFQGITAGYAGKTDFLASGVPISTAVLTSMAAANGGNNNARPYQFMIGYRTVGLFANFPAFIGTGMQFNMTACDLAMILTAQVSSWTSPGLSFAAQAAQYPDVFTSVSDTKITVYVQSGNVASTSFVTGYLARACPAVWTYGATGFPTNMVAAAAASGLLNVVQVATEDDLHEKVWVTPFSIGWSDVFIPLDRGLTTFAMQTANGTFAIPSNTASRANVKAVFDVKTAANAFPTADGDFSGVAFLFPDNQTTWPITATIWLSIQSTSVMSSRAALLKAYVKSFYNWNVQNSIAADLNFGPLDDSIQAYFLAELERLIPDSGLGASAFFFETATSVQRPADFSLSVNRASDVFTRMASIAADIDAIKQQLMANLPLALDGSGSSVILEYVGQVMTMLRDRAKIPVQMGFRSIGTDLGLEEFLGADRGFVPYTGFGIGETRIPNATHTQLLGMGIEVAQVPVVISTVGFFHSVPGIDDTTGPLNLTACVLAGIYQRRILTWNDEKILDLNPNWRVWAFRNKAQNFHILLNYRSGSSALTHRVTSYFQDASLIRCPGQWVKNATYVAAEAFPTGTDIYPQSSESNMVDTISSTPMSIGYMSAGFARDKNLDPILIDDADGNFQNPYTADPYLSIRMNEFPLSPLDDFSNVTFTFRTGGCWPMVMVSVLWVRRDIRFLGQASALLKALIQMLLSDEGQALIPTFGFYNLPAAMLAFSRKAIHDLYVSPDANPFMFEDSPMMGTGAGTFVISKSRSSITAFETGRIYQAIGTAENVLNATIYGVGSRVGTLEATKYPDKLARAQGAAALAFGVAAFLLGLANVIFFFMYVAAKKYVTARVMDSSEDYDEEGNGGRKKAGGKASGNQKGSKYSGR